MTNAQITILVLLPIVVWRFYSRYRKLVGKQHVRPGKLWTSVILFPLLFVLVALGSINNQSALMWQVLGSVVGLCLSFVGHKLTKFENNAGELTYTPNAYIGLGLLVIFFGRFAYRMFQLKDMAQQQGQDAMQHINNSPATLFVIGLLFCYYAAYSAGILMWRRRELSAKPV